MKLYQSAMEHCAPPEGLEARLRQAVLAAEPPEKRRVFRPRGFVRKALLAAVLAVILTVSAGAALSWDRILTGRFGELAASTPMGRAAFQEVYVTSICDDVTLTVRQALISDDTVHLVLDYRLPDTVDREWLAELDADGDALIFPPKISYYATGEETWEDLKAANGEVWATLDWTDYTSYIGYLNGDSLLWPDRFTRGGSSETASEGYDPETNTLTYLLRYTIRSDTQTLGGQPLTLLVTPPVAEDAAGTKTALAEHPAILTFQPEYASQTLTGTWQDGESGWTLDVTLSPFAIQVESTLGAFEGPDELLYSAVLVFRDGTETPVTQLGQGLSGSSGGDADTPYPAHVTVSTSFRELLDVSQVKAVRVGDASVEIN